MGSKKKKKGGRSRKKASKPTGEPRLARDAHGANQPKKRGLPMWIVPVGFAVMIAAPLIWIQLTRTTPPTPDLAGVEAEVERKILEHQRLASAHQDDANWGRYGMVLDAHGYEEQAAFCYGEASRIAPLEHRWKHLLALNLSSRDPERALVLAEEAIALDEGYLPSATLGARLAEQLGDLQKAKGLYSSVLAQKGGAVEAVLGFGRVLLLEEDYQQALQYLEQAHSIQPMAEPVLSVLARAYQATAQETKAEAIIAELDALDTPNGVGQAIPRDDPLERLVFNESVSTLGYENRAIEAAGSGDFLTASGLYERVIENEPDNEKHHYMYATFRERVGDIPGAEQAFRRVLELAPNNITVHLKHGTQLLRLGRLEEARDVMMRGLSLDPNEPNLHYAVAQVHGQLGDDERARVHFEKVTGLTPKYGPAYVRLAELAIKAGRLAEARRRIQRAESLGEKVSEDLRAELR